jgi:hypothetical protein
MQDFDPAYDRNGSIASFRAPASHFRFTSNFGHFTAPH